jgi:Na+(H+)/acetate symporter ActP
MNTKENWNNLIWFSKYKRIQEFDIKYIKKKRKSVIFLLFFIVLIFFTEPIIAYYLNWDKDALKTIYYLIIFFMFFLPPWFINFWIWKNYSFYRNKNKIIIIKNNL